MKRKVFISFIVLLILVYSTFLFVDCRIPIKNDTKGVHNIVSSVKVCEDFCLSEISSSFETVYVMPPYSSNFFEQRQLETSDNVKKRLERASLNDGICHLLFVKNRKIVSFAEVSRDVADFSTVSTDSFGKNTILYLDEKNVVHVK